jgi:hypothetical protein
MPEEAPPRSISCSSRCSRNGIAAAAARNGILRLPKCKLEVEVDLSRPYVRKIKP